MRDCAAREFPHYCEGDGNHTVDRGAGQHLECPAVDLDLAELRGLRPCRKDRGVEDNGALSARFNSAPSDARNPEHDVGIDLQSGALFGFERTAVVVDQVGAGVQRQLDVRSLDRDAAGVDEAEVVGVAAADVADLAGGRRRDVACIRELGRRRSVARDCRPVPVKVNPAVAEHREVAADGQIAVHVDRTRIVEAFRGPDTAEIERGKHVHLHEAFVLVRGPACCQLLNQ